MGQVLQQIVNHLRLNLRNRMAMIYGYLFPLIFLVAFWAIYHNDRVPLLLHMGELLTVTVLGGACFGLPTTMVSERERGVWRRYRLSPAPAWVFVVGVLAARYMLLLTAALLQLAVAMAIGMTAPRHPLSLLAAFTVTSVAFLGLGMVIAMLADSVPTVQALGQCIFLPMLMIGGVAVRLASLPRWALHVSAFFPGRYAVEAIQASITGAGLSTGPGRSNVHFDLLALGLIGVAGMMAAICTFRWNPKERSAAETSRLWLLLAVGMWVVVGVMAERQGRIAPSAVAVEEVGFPQEFLKAAPVPKSVSSPDRKPPEIKAPETNEATKRPDFRAKEHLNPARTPDTRPLERKRKASGPSSWQQVTKQDLNAFAFDRLPSDEGLIAPVAHSGETWDPSIEGQLEQIRTGMMTWPPGRVSDPVQRARNDLYVAAVPDVLEMAQLERFVPPLVFSRLKADIPPDDLPKILYWIAMHPADGDDTAVRHMDALGLPTLSGPTKEVRNRVMLYALKLLGRITGQISG